MSSVKPKQQTPDPLHVGDRLLARYNIVERITAGGHSIVYRGEDERLCRPVCIKVFHRMYSKDGAYRTAYEHFVQEAFALSKLNHPNTLRIYDFGYLPGNNGQELGAPFQVSEYLNNGTLWTHVKHGGILPRAEAIDVITALCGALGEAHQCDIIHRDIKPHNILFGLVGRGLVVKLADFGIAKSLSNDRRSLQNRADDTSVVVGRPFLMYSPWWAAPEQLSGEQVTRAADIYSMALSVIFMLTGKVVFRENEPVNAYKQRKSSDALVEATCDGCDLPAVVVQQLKQACSFHPQHRVDDVELFGSALVDGLRQSADRASQPRLESVPCAGVEADDSGRVATPPRRLRVSEEGGEVAGRRIRFIPAPAGAVTLSCGAAAARVRVAFVPDIEQFCVHVRGMSCFVSRDQGRPSSAAQFDGDGLCHLLAPNQRLLARIAVSRGRAAAGHRVFAIDGESIAVSLDECPEVVGFDFGAGDEYWVIYRPNPTLYQGF